MLNDIRTEIENELTDRILSNICADLEKRYTYDDYHKMYHDATGKLCSEIDIVIADLSLRDEVINGLCKLQPAKKKDTVQKQRFHKYSMSKHDTLSFNVGDQDKRYTFNYSKYSLLGVIDLFLKGTFDDRLFNAMLDYYGNNELTEAFLMSLTEQKYYDMCDSFISAVLKDDDLLYGYFDIKREIVFDRSKLKKDKFFGGN